MLITFHFIWQIKLIAYKLEHGDCKVKQTDKLNKQLGQWVNTQRNELGPLIKSVNASHEDRSKIDVLNTIGFRWPLRRTAINTNGQRASLGNGLSLPAK